MSVCSFNNNFCGDHVDGTYIFNTFVCSETHAKRDVVNVLQTSRHA